jgi:DNA-binding transcriptional MerR regulator
MLDRSGKDLNWELSLRCPSSRLKGALPADSIENVGGPAKKMLDFRADSKDYNPGVKKESVDAQSIRIGGLASAAGVSTHTIRYYEHLKLLPTPRRTYSGYRLYTREHIERLRQIKQAQELGFSLDEIKEILVAKREKADECHWLRDLLKSKLELVAERLAQLQAIERSLIISYEKCEQALSTGTVSGCPVLLGILNDCCFRAESDTLNDSSVKEEFRTKAAGY